MDRIDRLPIVGGLLEFVGLLVTGWFVYRYLLFGPDRWAPFLLSWCSVIALSMKGHWGSVDTLVEEGTFFKLCSAAGGSVGRDAPSSPGEVQHLQGGAEEQPQVVCQQGDGRKVLLSGRLRGGTAILEFCSELSRGRTAQGFVDA